MHRFRVNFCLEAEEIQWIYRFFIDGRCSTICCSQRASQHVLAPLPEASSRQHIITSILHPDVVHIPR